MKYYKDQSDGFYILVDGQVNDGWIEITKQEYDLHNPIVVAIPQSVTMRQARLALMNAGLLSNVDTIINSLPEPQQTIARISWDYSSMVERANPVFIQLATALVFSSAQLDQLFIDASKL